MYQYEFFNYLTGEPYYVIANCREDAIAHLTDDLCCDINAVDYIGRVRTNQQVR